MKVTDSQRERLRQLDTPMTAPRYMRSRTFHEYENLGLVVEDETAPNFPDERCARLTDLGLKIARVEPVEREKFEEWFARAYGAQPVGVLEDLRCQVAELEAQIRRVEWWNLQYRAALAAWHERHGRDEGTRS